MLQFTKLLNSLTFIKLSKTSHWNVAILKQTCHKVGDKTVLLSKVYL